MKTIKIEPRVGDPSIKKHRTPFSGIKFAWCSKSHQGSKFHNCRETFVYCMKKKIKPDIYDYNIEEDINIDKLRILVYMKKKLRTKKEAGEYNDQADGFMENALKAIHFFERYAGWKPTSEVYKVDMGLSFKCYTYMFEADSKWIKNPYMISLFTLLIRCGKFSEIGNIRNYAHFAKISKMLLHGKRKAIKERAERRRKKLHHPKEETSRFLKWPCPDNTDTEYLYYVACKLDIILNNYDDLLGSKKIKAMFNYSAISEGIVSLCRDLSVIRKVRIQLRELCIAKNIPLKTRIPDYKA